MAQISFDRVYKLFGDVVAVDDLSLDIRDGEFLVLVGPSGCGKTTSLRMLAGFERATYGTVSIGGVVQNTVAPQNRDLAMVFQSYALYPHMTVYKNLAFGMKVRREPRAEVRPRVEEVARLLDIETLLDRRPSELSGGQRQRVALGRALLRSPRAFLMDEPLSNLDAALRVQMRVELKHLHDRLGVTTVYVTHDQVEAMTMGDRIAIMNAGRLQQADTPEAIYVRPANLFVAGFIGSPKMNLVSGRVSSQDGRVAAEFLGQ
ncbi:MAG: multiple sugar transport system ATP-binding protein, partial [Gaiellales bacterium]|nr:multiple sugar transport system ATP-binding protein [Gaiellales bacterium]